MFLGATFLIYFMVFAMPGDPIAALFGDRPPAPGVIEQIREQYHLDEPFIVQYFYYLAGIFQGDFGVTYSGQSVNDVLARTFPVTIRLALLAIFFEMVAGIFVGLVCGLRKGGIFDATGLGVSLVLISLPIFVIGFVAQYFLAIQLGWFSPTVGAGAPLEDLILPALVLASISFAQIVRLTRASVIDTASLDFVRTAYSKGLTRRRIVPVHVLRNSLIPVITYLGTDFGTLLVGATVTEGIFNVPGVGDTLFQAILRGEGPTDRVLRHRHGALYLIVNLLIDLSTPCSTRGSAMPDIDTTTSKPRPEHFVAPLEETPLDAIDAIKAEGKPSNLWIDAWHDLRQRPMFWISLGDHPHHRVHRPVPRPVHARAAERELPARQQQRRARPRGTRSGSPARAATSGRASCTARRRRSPSASS